MKKIFSPLIIILVVSSSLFAQQYKNQDNRRADRENMKAEKIAFITNKLNLSVEEAQQFWPVYNEFSNSFDVLIDKEHKLRSKLHDDESENLNLEKDVDDLIQLEVDRALLRKEYHSKYKKVLDINKISKLYKAEEDFKRELLRKYRKHPHGNEQPNR